MFVYWIQYNNKKFCCWRARNTIVWRGWYVMTNGINNYGINNSLHWHRWAEWWAIALTYWIQLVKLGVEVISYISIFDYRDRATRLQKRAFATTSYWSKCRQTQTSTTKTSTHRDVDKSKVYKPKRQYTTKFVPFMSFQYHHLLKLNIAVSHKYQSIFIRITLCSFALKVLQDHSSWSNAGGYEQLLRFNHLWNARDMDVLYI